MLKISGFAAPYMLGVVIGVTVVSTSVANQAREKNQSSYNKYIKQKQNYMRNTARGLDYAVATENSYKKASKNRLNKNFYSNAFDVGNSLDLSTKGAKGERVSIISGDSNSYKRKNRGKLNKRSILKQDLSGKAVLALNENRVRKEQVLKSYANMREASKELYENIIATKSFKMPCILNPSKKDAWGRKFTYSYIDDMNSNLSFNLPWNTNKKKVLPIKLPKLIKKTEVPKLEYFFAHMSSFVFSPDQGLVWGSGYNGSGIMGFRTVGSSRRDYETTWKKLGITDVKSITPIERYTLLVETNSGEQYVSGRVIASKLGIPMESDDAYRFNKIDLGSKIVQMEYFDSNFYAITENGELWGAGFNKYGQLGTGDKVAVNSFTKLNIPEKVIDVVSASVGTFAVTESGNVWASGVSYTNGLGLGLSHGGNTGYVWVKTNLSNVKELISKRNYSYAITKNNELWATGSATWGNFGNGSNAKIPTWRKLPLADVEKVYVAKTVDSVAVFAINKSGELYVTGQGAYGVLGLGHTNNINRWEKTPITSPVKEVISTYRAAMFAVTTNNKLWVTGSNGIGALGLNTSISQQNTWIESDVPYVYKAYAYSPRSSTRATFIIDENKDLYFVGTAPRYMGMSPKKFNNWKTLKNTRNIKEYYIDDDHIMAITEDNELYAVGSANSYNTGIASTTIREWTKSVEKGSEILPGESGGCS
tara:strand:+ start:1451 stop:3568 length:2118 start_codon:yes stop_codon:yes gene_type:complete